MTTETTETSVRASTVVEAPIEHAFTVFTEGIDSWWNPDHHIIEAPLDHMVFEPRVGGLVYDVGTDGSTCAWARVLAYDPPDRLVFSWDIDLHWKRESDPDKCSEVEVRFTAVGPTTTRVDLEHRHLERHGEGWEAMAAGVGSPGGWPAGVELFAAAVRQV